MIAALKGLQFKQRDNTNQTYMHEGTQRKKQVEILKEKMQMCKTRTEREFLHLWKTGCKYQKIVQLWSLTPPMPLQHPQAHVSPKEGGGQAFWTVHPFVANQLCAESFQPEIHWSALLGMSGNWAPQGKDVLPSVSTLQALAAPHRPTKVDGLAMYYRISPWAKSETLCKLQKCFWSSWREGQNPRRKARSLEQTSEIQVIQSQHDSHAEHKFSTIIATRNAQPRSKGFTLHGSLKSGCSHFLGAFTVVVETEWWHVLIERKCSLTQFCLELLLPWLFVFCSSKLGSSWAIDCKEKPEKASDQVKSG